MHKTTHARVNSRDNGDMTVEYLSLQDVAARLGVSRNTAAKLRLPEPDVRVGSGLNAPRGWSAKTIDEWNAKRPGSGRWGARKTVEKRGRKA